MSLFTERLVGNPEVDTYPSMLDEAFEQDGILTCACTRSVLHYKLWQSSHADRMDIIDQSQRVGEGH